MIQTFVDKFMASKARLRERFATERPDSYQDLVKRVVEVLHDDEDYNSIDPSRITTIDHGHYQGTLVFVIGASGYQPYDYWYVKIGYGSCSGCDTLQSIQEWGDTISEKEVDGYMTLALHIVQGLKKMGDD